MPNSPRLQTPYPSGSTANDFDAHMQAIAEGPLDSAIVYASGLLAGRPAASALAGKVFRVTDTNTSAGLFFSDGSNWIRITPSPWAGWSVTQSISNGSTVSST